MANSTGTAVGNKIFNPIPHCHEVHFSQIKKLNIVYCWCFNMFHHPTFFIHQNFRTDLTCMWVQFKLKHFVLYRITDPPPINFTTLSKKNKKNLSNFFRKKKKKKNVNVIFFFFDMWHVTRDRWHMIRDTSWHVTRHTWHVTRDMFGGVNIHSKFQLPSSYETLQACASISVPKLCNFHLQYLVNFVKN